MKKYLNLPKLYHIFLKQHEIEMLDGFTVIQLNAIRIRK